MAMNEIFTIKQYFANKHISLSDEWLKGCLTWVREEYSNSSLEEIQLKVFEQWQLLDLRDVQIPVLPQRITQQKHLVIDKPFCLQLMSIIDISKPKLHQIQKIRNSNIIANHSEETISGKRVLQLTLTDGVQEILATEYKPNPTLNINMSPGLKLLILPPITIRRGTIFLEPTSINVLGGEVEDLLITNAPENILAKALGMPINNNPVILQETAVKVEETKKIVPPRRVIQSNLEPNLFDDVDFNDDVFNQIDAIETASQNETKTLSRINEDNRVVKPGSNKRISLDDYKEADEDELNEMLQIERELQQSPPKQAKPGMTIERLLGMRSRVTRGKFTVRAKFCGIVQKMKIADNEYSIKITVGDDTGEMDVHVHTDVVADMVGYDVEAMMALKNNEDAVILATRLKAMEGFREKLLHLDNRIEILMESSRDAPTIVQILKN